MEIFKCMEVFKYNLSNWKVKKEFYNCRYEVNVYNVLIFLLNDNRKIFVLKVVN